MPTLFDDEEYFVPPPKKESRKKKDQPEAKEAASNEAETDALADPVVPAEPLTEADTQPVVDTDDAVAETTAAEQPVEEVIAATEADDEIALEPEAAIVLTEEAPEDVPEPVAEGTTEAVLTEAVPEAEVAAEPAADEPLAAVEEVIEETPEAIEPSVPVTPAEEEMPATSEVAVADAAPEAEVSEAHILAEDSQETTIVATQVPVMEEVAIETSAAEELTAAPEEEVSEAPEMDTEQFVELEQEDMVTENIAADPFQEIIEVSAVDEFAVELPKAVPGIAFEIPEEGEEPAIELEMTARPIPTVREDKVDDLDQLMRTELISQDYTAFSGFAFEPQPEKKKIIPEPEAEVSAEGPAITPGKEDISLAVQDIDAAALDFEFESAALASSLPEFDLENKYYTIGEVAALFAVNVSHIRFWTTEFNLKVRTTRKGDRLYNPENIARLRLIHHLVKENGFTIKGAKDKLKHQKQNVSSQIDLKNKLSGLKDKLERIKKNL